MKTIRNLALYILTLAVSAAAFAAKPIPGPKGGRILTTGADATHVEFFVEKDRTVTVSFYDKALKPVAPSGQVVSATAEAKTGKVQLVFAEKNGALVSNAALPQGDDYTIVVQVRDSQSARPKNYRVLFHDEFCSECKRAEYACVCEDAGKEHDHDKKKK